jgi:SAM-dependent methyltransferase
MPKTTQIELEFSKKYDREHAQQYFIKHNNGIARRLSHWRDEQVARKALKLAGQPSLVLDLPCGAGRFWPLLAEQDNRVIIAADNSADMLNIARASQPESVVSRVKTFKTSAFSIDLQDRAVDCIFCIRLLHHIQSSEHRLTILKEFHRVSRDTLILSLWVDGNFKAWRRQRLEARRATKGRSGQNKNRFIVPRALIEGEFEQAGWDIIGFQDFIPGYAMWRTYTLRKAD